MEKREGIKLLLAAHCHLGSKNCDHNMERYVSRKKNDGTYIINLEKTWDKLQIAARVIVAVRNPQDVVVQAWKTNCQRAASKFAHHVGVNLLSERHVPGTFTNQTQKRFKEPGLILVSNPNVDHLSIKETRFAQLPVIAFCDTDSSLKNVDIAIPANNKEKNSIGVLYYLLARMIKQMKGQIAPGQSWDVSVDTFIQQDIEE